MLTLRLCRYGKPLLGPGLTIGSKGSPGTATEALADWSRQFGPTGDATATKPKVKDTAKKPAAKEKPVVKTKKEVPEMESLKNSKGASPNMMKKSKDASANKKQAKSWQATVDAIADPEEKAHAEAKYSKRDEELAKQGTRDEL